MFFKNQIKKRMKNEKGLTLVELLAVIVILGIIAAISVPAIGNIIENSRYKAAKSDALNVMNAANLYFVDKNSPEDSEIDVANLIQLGYLDNAGTFGKNDAGADLSTTPGTIANNKIASPVGAKITKKTGGNIIDGTVSYSGEKKVQFSSVTVEHINSDDKSAKQALEGSTNNTITIAPPTP